MTIEKEDTPGTPATTIPTHFATPETYLGPHNPSDAESSHIKPGEEPIDLESGVSHQPSVPVGPSRIDKEAKRRDLPPKYDVEYNHAKPWTKYPLGYPRFAAFMASDEDKSTTIFRRFQRLSARNLLYLESELADLEAEQDRLDALSRDDDNLKKSMKGWNLLCLQATPPEGEPAGESADEAKRRLSIQDAAQQRLHLAWRIREVLKVYR